MATTEENKSTDAVQPTAETPNTIQVPAKDVIEQAEGEKTAPATVPETPEKPKDDELDVQDGRRLDQNVKAAEFDKEKEEELAHAEPPEEEERVKESIKNPNGAGNEWPRV